MNINGIGCGHLIAGRVTDETGQAVEMVPNIARSVSNNSDKSSGMAYADSDGNYSIPALMPLSDYIVFAVPMNYKNQYYNNSISLATASLVNIATGNVSGIYLVLTEGLI